MYLVDTSAWIRHFRGQDTPVEDLLESNEVLIHPFIIGELACGTLKNRQTVLELLEALPCVLTVEHKEALAFVNENKLSGSGIGWVDAHLLASSLLNKCRLLSYDKALSRVAGRLGLVD